MAKYQVKVAKSAVGDLKAIADKKDRKKIIKALEKLEVTPRPRGVEKLTDRPGFLRMRVGDYRIIYSILSDRHLLLVLVVRDRKDVYKALDHLDNKLAAALMEIVEGLDAGTDSPSSLN